MPDPADILRSNRTGVLLAGEEAVPCRFILDPAGRIVTPVDTHVLESPQHVLFVPDEDAAALQLLLHAHPFVGADPPIADRWRAYHGTPRATRWAAFEIESARLGPLVVDAPAVTSVNPLSPQEPALCRRANADRAALRAACRRTGVDVPDPLCVGVDPHGLDVRARFGIVRLSFSKPAGDSAAAAASQVDALLASGDDPSP
jgi:hypothetical protein